MTNHSPADRADWVGFNDKDFPIAFGMAQYCSLEEMKEDTPNAVRWELVTDRDELSRLLGVHRGPA